MPTFSLALFCADTEQSQVLSSVGSREECQVWPSESPWAPPLGHAGLLALGGARVVGHFTWPPWQDLKYLPSHSTLSFMGCCFTFLVSQSAKFYVMRIITDGETGAWGEVCCNDTTACAHDTFRFVHHWDPSISPDTRGSVSVPLLLLMSDSPSQESFCQSIRCCPLRCALIYHPCALVSPYPFGFLDHHLKCSSHVCILL